MIFYWFCFLYLYPERVYCTSEWEQGVEISPSGHGTRVQSQRWCVYFFFCFLCISQNQPWLIAPYTFLSKELLPPYPLWFLEDVFIWKLLISQKKKMSTTSNVSMDCLRNFFSKPISWFSSVVFPASLNLWYFNLPPSVFIQLKNATPSSFTKVHLLDSSYSFHFTSSSHYHFSIWKLLTLPKYFFPVPFPPFGNIKAVLLFNSSLCIDQSLLIGYELVDIFCLIK